MRAFAQLLDDLVYTRSRNTKLKLIGDYLKATPDPDRGIALAALECLAHRSSQLALLPGHRVALRCCLEHMDEALSSNRSTDTNAILAALALRLH